MLGERAWLMYGGEKINYYSLPLYTCSNKINPFYTVKRKSAKKHEIFSFYPIITVWQIAKPKKNKQINDSSNPREIKGLIKSVNVYRHNTSREVDPGKKTECIAI